MKKYLSERGIDTNIHYPIPIHLQDAAKNLGYQKGDFPITEKQSKTILSLPVFLELINEQILYICDRVFEFYSKG